MINQGRGRRVGTALVGWAAVGMLGGAAQAQAPAGKAAAGKATAGQAARAGPQDEVSLKPVRIPVTPGDPVAVVNGEVITRQQLADECVTRKGEEVLDTLVARKLIDQAIKAKKL